MQPKHDILVTSAPGMAGLLAQELEKLSLTVTNQAAALVSCEGSVADALRVCLHSHLAERVLWPVATAEATPDEAPEALAAAFDWETHLSAADAVHVEVEFSGSLKLNGIQLARRFIAAAPKQLNLSPEAHNALTLHLFVSETRAQLTIDISGEPLQRRGYRLAGGIAPLRETLAAGMLLSAGWQADRPLLDPFCGSGTILIEAAMMARRLAPGLQRDFYGFMQWSGCEDGLWETLCAKAREQERPLPEAVTLKGFDASKEAMRYAQANAERAGVAKDIHFERRQLGALKKRDFEASGLAGSLVTNPPWGERLENRESAAWLHAGLGQKLAALAPDWQATIIGASVDVMDACGMTLESQHTLRNGRSKNWIRQYLPKRPAAVSVLQAGAPEFELEAAAIPLANRLQKNAKFLKNWLKKEQVTAYRLYDRDLPEFNFTIDVYGDKVLMREQKAPNTIPESKVKARRQLALQTVRACLGCYPEQVFLRTRERQKGNQQYRKLASKGRYYTVKEGQANLLINLQDYHDTGLFLDHRLMRLRLAQEAKGKRFLNLFAYTGSASVHAAAGGAKSSVTVDASNHYLGWAANNLALNGFSSLSHHCVQADVMNWVNRCRDAFDIIFCDPPTFSNSKSRPDFVVQRDHAELIGRLMPRLEPGGVLYFSCNFKGFVMDEGIGRWYAVKDISRATLDRDFSRQSKVHYCFEIRHA